jgi:carboxyl-terminal processing protease
MFYTTPDLTTVKNMFKKVYLLVLLAAALACKASPSKPIKVMQHRFGAR